MYEIAHPAARLGRGNTGTLANGPVSCSGTANGVVVTTTMTSYTLTTADGHSMSLSSAGTASASGQTCSLSLSSNLTR